MRKDWAWRAGLGTWRAGIDTFFRFGGLSWLKRKYKVGVDERMGHLDGVPQGSIWVHAVSVGEAQSASALIKKMKEDPGPADGRPCLLSTVTETGRAMAEQLIGPLADRMIYSPWDTRRFIKSALDSARPSVYITMETELWPEMLSQLKERGIPTFLANGRVSDRGYKKFRRCVPFWRGLLSCFTHLFVRFEEDKARFMSLGLSEEMITVTGDCKVDALLNRREKAKPELWRRLRRGDAPLIVAGSTHQGEDDIVISAFRKIRENHPGARLVIVPRHPERALMVVAAALPYPELSAQLLSKIGADNNWDIAAVDRIGVLFDLYAASDAAFVGGSLVDKGGQNPWEPIMFGIPTSHGPSMTDFPDTDRMNRMGAAKCVHNDLDLARAWEEALDPASRDRIKAACFEYCATLGGAAERTWSAIKSYI